MSGVNGHLHADPLQELQTQLGLGLNCVYACAYQQYEQALVCLSNREIADASRWCTFHCKLANNRCFL